MICDLIAQHQGVSAQTTAQNNSLRKVVMAVVLSTLALITLPVSVAQAHISKGRFVKPDNKKLERMARCESTGRWNISTGNGFYGGLQFNYQTWRSVGGTGYPHQNSKLEQKYRAVKLIRRAGYSPWPRCGLV